MLTMIAAACLAWSLFDPSGNVPSLKLNEAIVDEASAAPPITGSIDADKAGL